MNDAVNAIPAAEVTVDYIWLSSEQQRQHAQDAHRYLCRQLQMIYVENIRLESDIKSQG